MASRLVGLHSLFATCPGMDVSQKGLLKYQSLFACAQGGICISHDGSITVFCHWKLSLLLALRVCLCRASSGGMVMPITGLLVQRIANHGSLCFRRHSAAQGQGVDRVARGGVLAR